ncbi:MAG: hypothetical protein JW751_11810 [Polyangiaceae bacterium]|nr:hypothetical protein [Polyangiaceae bacterium]
MKAVVTILQCRRAVLPHLFVKHVLPKMRVWFPGLVDCVIIQHRVDASGGNTALESLAGGTGGIATVRQWTEAGRYDGAEIIGHEIVHRPYPTVPGYHLAVKAALDRGADFHLMLEDDAIVIDPECGRWDELLGRSEVGVYRKFHEINTAYYVARPSFDRRIVGLLANYRSFSWKTRMEPFLRRQLHTSRAYLEPSYAVRYHHRDYPHTGLRYVVDRIRTLAPEDVSLLDVDFGPGCAKLPPVTSAEQCEHAARDGAGALDRIRRLRARAVQGVYRAIGR